MATRKKKEGKQESEKVDNCENCHFAHDSGNAMSCRRYPPLPIFDLESGNLEAIVPIVGVGWWCGEWKPKLNS